MMEYENRDYWFSYPISGFFCGDRSGIGLSRLHIELTSRSHTASGLLIHELAHYLLGHSHGQVRFVRPMNDSYAAWGLLDEVEADIVTFECLKKLGFHKEAELRRRRYEAHIAMDTRTSWLPFNWVMRDFHGVGPLLRVVGRHILPKDPMSNPRIEFAIDTLLGAVSNRHLVLETDMQHAVGKVTLSTKKTPMKMPEEFFMEPW